jgi:hypothetical protein
MLWEWLKATFSNWQSWLSGGGFGGACVVLIALVEQFTNWKLSRQWRIVLFLVVFVLGASFMSWKSERQKLLSSSEEISSLKKQISYLSQSAIGAQIEFAILGQQPQGSHAGIIVSLHNSGAASAVLPNSWKLTAVAEDGRVVEGWANTLKDKNLDFCTSHNRGMRFVRGDALYLKAADSPIERNGYKQGFLWFGFPSLSRATLVSSGTKLILSAQSVSGQDIKTEITVAALQEMSRQPTQFFAGIENPSPIDMQCRENQPY